MRKMKTKWVKWWIIDYKEGGKKVYQTRSYDKNYDGKFDILHFLLEGKTKYKKNERWLLIRGPTFDRNSNVEKRTSGWILWINTLKSMVAICYWNETWNDYYDSNGLDINLWMKNSTLWSCIMQCQENKKKICWI